VSFVNSILIGGDPVNAVVSHFKGTINVRFDKEANYSRLFSATLLQ